MLSADFLLKFGVCLTLSVLFLRSRTAARLADKAQDFIFSEPILEAIMLFIGLAVAIVSWHMTGFVLSLIQ